MTTINLEDIQRDVLGLMQRVQEGETFVIAQDGRPLGRWEPVPASVSPQPPVDLNGKRQFGTLAGKIEIPDDFNEMMREEIEEMFYGKP